MFQLKFVFQTIDNRMEREAFRCGPEAASSHWELKWKQPECGRHGNFWGKWLNYQKCSVTWNGIKLDYIWSKEV